MSVYISFTNTTKPGDMKLSSEPQQQCKQPVNLALVIGNVVLSSLIKSYQAPYLIKVARVGRGCSSSSSGLSATAWSSTSRTGTVCTVCTVCTVWSSTSRTGIREALTAVILEHNHIIVIITNAIIIIIIIIIIRREYMKFLDMQRDVWADGEMASSALDKRKSTRKSLSNRKSKVSFKD